MRKLKEKKGKWEKVGKESLVLGTPSYLNPCRLFGHKWGYAINKIESRIVIMTTEANANVKVRKCKRCGCKERLFVDFIY